MNTSTRRGITYPQADRSDPPDVPAHFLNVINALEVDFLYKQGTDSARIAFAHTTSGGLLWYATDTGLFWYDDGTTWHLMTGEAMGGNIASTANITISAPSHKITGTTTIDQITDSQAFAGKTVKLIFQSTITVRHNVSNIRLNGGIHAGFVANEVLVLIYDGTNWLEDTRTAKHLSGQGGIVYGGTATPTGLVAEDGSAISRTGFAALFANIGTLFGVGDGSTTFNVPDSRGRADFGYVATGGHADMATIGNNDGVTLTSRRVAHKHTVTGGSSGFIGGGGFGSGSSGFTVTSILVGPQTGAEPTDVVPYLVRPKFTRI